MRGRALGLALCAAALGGCGVGYARCSADAHCPPEARCDTVHSLCVAVQPSGPGPCESDTCPGGCCAGGVCKNPSVWTCGRAGVACVECDPLRADRCGGDGACQCGAGAVCQSGQRCAGGGVCVNE